MPEVVSGNTAQSQISLNCNLVNSVQRLIVERNTTTKNTAEGFQNLHHGCVLNGDALIPSRTLKNISSCYPLERKDEGLLVKKVTLTFSATIPPECLPSVKSTEQDHAFLRQAVRKYVSVGFL